MATYSSAPSIEYVEFTKTKSGSQNLHVENTLLVSSVPENTIYELEEFFVSSDSGGVAVKLIAIYDTNLGVSNPDIFAKDILLMANGSNFGTHSRPESVSSALSFTSIGTNTGGYNTTAEIFEYQILTQDEQSERRIGPGFKIYSAFATSAIEDGDAQYWMRFKKTTYN